MSIKKDEVWESVLIYLENKPHCIFSHAIRIIPFINNKDREDKFLEILYRQLMQSANIGIYRPIEQLLEETNKNKQFPVERSLMQRRLAESYMKLIKDEKSAVRVIHFAQKAASIYKQLKDKEEENKCLAVISRHIEADNPDWQQTEFEFPAEFSDALNTNIKVIQEFFSDTNINIQERISCLSKFITEKNQKLNKNILLYKPFVLISDINNTAEEFNKSVFLQLASVVTLDKNKVIANGNNNIMRAKELAYPMHQKTNILPALNALENSKDFSINEIKNLIQECKLVSDDELIFISEALDDYSKERWVPFICVIVPSFESILRRLYFEIEGTSIQAKNTDTLVHTTVNLSNVLSNKKVREILSEDFVIYLEYLLNSDTSSENIRNNVAHRFTQSDFYTKERSQVLIHALLQLCLRGNKVAG
ncbi:hypothetical protein BKP45_21040 [Anaerobacillus alkalidiazotrophicus]|uniref:DUF4209 domain-containing protein n=1 Tax=Anaerobacillus alkalidiazotrophicus TaxID=472963 RepID=A0A1S2LYJ2_9BACI|nr:DUF4209 domain-containing protein [Anaerobacillus alkalidiazotrophicus]OIJ16495.1 hypothetical protein BKP45_21040 [Anaerobacillus alkalidiazotrophicus]